MPSSSGEPAVRSGAEVFVTQPRRHGVGLGLLDFFFLCLVWLSASEPASSSDNTAAAATQRFHAAKLVLARRRGVGIVAEGVGITLREDFHQPAIKVIHWDAHDGLKTPVVTPT